MAWFITTVDPNLPVTCADGHTIRFRHAEYRTVKPDEVMALRANANAHEVLEKTPARPTLRRWALNLVTGKLHDIERRRFQCYLSDEIIAASCEEEGTPTDRWALYHRREDAVRWNRGLKPCGHCGGGTDG